jgi:hypothetical protein
VSSGENSNRLIGTHFWTFKRNVMICYTPRYDTLSEQVDRTEKVNGFEAGTSCSKL